MIYTEKISFDFSNFSNENLNEIIKLCEKEKEKRRRLDLVKGMVLYQKPLCKCGSSAPEKI